MEAPCHDGRFEEEEKPYSSRPKLGGGWTLVN